jgi:hypothetical protein
MEKWIMVKRAAPRDPKVFSFFLLCLPGEGYRVSIPKAVVEET